MTISSKSNDVATDVSNTAQIPSEISAQLAKRLISLSADSLPATTLHAARRCLIDAIGCASAGRQHAACLQARQWAEGIFFGAGASVWFSNQRLSPIGAAFVNATAASILDLDDGHRVAAGHPGAAIIPAVLAEAEQMGSSLDDILVAIVAGYEIGVGCASRKSAAAKEAVATGRWSAIGVAAALAKLKGLDTQQVQHALTIAESHAPNLLAADHAGFRGGDVKEGIPWSVVAGFAAVGLAITGMRGYDSSFANPVMYSAWEDAGAWPDRHFIETAYFKRYACCRWTHSAVDAVSELVKNVKDVALIEGISIQTFKRAATLPNMTTPPDVISAQFSVPFAVGVAVVHGASTLLQFDEKLLLDTRVQSVANKVSVTVDETLDRMYPLKVPAHVQINSVEQLPGRLIVSPVGDFDNPMADADLVEKAACLAESNGVYLSRAHLDSLLVGELQASQVIELVSPGAVSVA